MRIARIFAALRRAHQNQHGLTAIELAVVVAILAILAGLVASNTTGMSTSARGSTQSTDEAEVQKAVDNYVGQNTASKYPTTGALVSCADGTTVTGTALTDLTRTGLATLDESNCVALDVSATFTTPDDPPVTKRFVPAFMQRNPKHVTESPNSWVIDSNGDVANVLSADKY